jgi:SET domain-containing protein
LTDQICDDSCACAKRGFCEKFCICNKNLCKNRFYGCRCSTNCLTSACPCYAAGRECDEDLCGNCRFESATETIVQGNRSIKIFCKDYYSKNNKCWNKVCKSGYSAKLSISKSDISGWGLFALQRIIKSQLIREYTGEILTDDECREREIWNCLEETTYMFKQNEEVK